MNDSLSKYPHIRFNALNGEWILVSPQRWERPWQGKIEDQDVKEKLHYKPDCYLCPGNIRANGEVNPVYKNTFTFTNDFSALLPDVSKTGISKKNLLLASTERGICRVVCFSPDHSLTLSEMTVTDIGKVVKEWINEFEKLGSHDYINNVLIFENKGELMGNSNPHPHCQIWAQENIPSEIMKECSCQKLYIQNNNECLLCSYLEIENKERERIIYSNDDFDIVVPFWAVWPYETLIISKRHFSYINQLSNEEINNFSLALSKLTGVYDKLFNTPFPYSSGIHQAPVDGKEYPEWHFHMHFYPPLLRSATIKKYMVGYEMFGNPQRDITPEIAAEQLRKLF